jgi:diaminohydroxyphosphoribosylaminopyrimidine deaminase/5-amino-6-(5-phosphoribosylamino)uracil reductase
MEFSKKDEFYMKRALTLAKRAQGHTSPNPMVGAVLVKRGRVIAEDYHRKVGTPHAEALVIERAAEEARGATLYVSLEPCCHTKKRTPPCTEGIIKAGIRRVVVSMVDPNPQVSGKGIKRLKEAGIEVQWGLLEEKARRLNESYIKYITTGRPFVTLKVAMSLDGKIALPTGESKWITSEASRKIVHRMRAASDAILTGIGTVRADDPLLTARIKGAKSPIRIVIDPELDIRPDARVLEIPPQTILITRVKDDDRIKRLYDKGVEFLFFDGELDFGWLMEELGRREITSVMVEAGSTLPSFMLKAGVVDKVVFFIAPIIIGGRDSYPAIGGPSCERLSEAFSVKDLRIRRIGPDIMVEGYLR